MKTINVAISITSEDHLKQAQQLAKQLGLDFILEPQNKEAQPYDYLLIFTDNYLVIQKTSDKKFAPFHVDFLSNKLTQRSQLAGLRNEMLARAMGCKPKDHWKIIDATAGWGRDSFILASLGFEVTMIERSPIVAALLQDGLNRAKIKTNAANHMHLIQDDTTRYLKTLSPHQQPDVIYLDPMFPERKKSALVKKEMVLLQDLLGKSDNNDDLFKTALTCAKHRVVVKRPRLAANIALQVPDFSLAGKSSRFDVYLIT